MISSNYLLYFMIAAMTLEILDLIFRGYTQVKSWDILREVIMERDFVKIFILQYAIGNVLPFIMMILPGTNCSSHNHCHRSGVIRSVHDALQRRYWRAGIFSEFCRVHGLSSADNTA